MSTMTLVINVGGSSSGGAAATQTLDKQAVPLFSAEEAKDLRSQWDAVQVNFVDEPRQVVLLPGGDEATCGNVRSGKSETRGVNGIAVIMSRPRISA
jgi:hypothetical protein